MDKNNQSISLNGKRGVYTGHSHGQTLKKCRNNSAVFTILTMSGKRYENL